MVYPIGVFSSKVGLAASTLRYYEQQKLLSVKRDKAGRRIYDETDIPWLAFIIRLKETGMPIREIAKEANISRDMVYRYLKDEGFNRYLDALIDEEIRSCEAAIWHRLKEMCLEGDLQAIKYYFDLRGKRAKGPEEGQGTVVQIIDDVPDLSPEELKEIYGPLAGEELTDDA